MFPYDISIGTWLFVEPVWGEEPDAPGNSGSAVSTAEAPAPCQDPDAALAAAEALSASDPTDPADEYHAVIVGYQFVPALYWYFADSEVSSEAHRASDHDDRRDRKDPPPLPEPGVGKAAGTTQDPQTD